MLRPPPAEVPTTLAILAALVAPVNAQPPPDVPVPPENPITEEKRVLGKILFWEEQLSTDDTVACGTCHRPASGGADPRVAIHPGADGIFFNEDDVFGSRGVVRRDSNGQPVEDPIFGFGPQVTRRSAPSFLTAQHATDIFWDGRARTTFHDPETGELLMQFNAALESQAVEPILSPVEMAKEGRTWNDVRAKLATVAPLGLAQGLPPDVAAAIAADPGYPDLFVAAFGDPQITAARIAMAIATYERTVFPDQTPWDLGTMTPEQNAGAAIFGAATDCVQCHEQPLFTEGSFRNLGIRPIAEDIGRQAVTGDFDDRAKFKAPSLRNVGLRRGLMHNGQRTTLEQVIDFYADPEQQHGDNVDPILPTIASHEDVIIDFLANGLTDPRAAAELFPFDRPTLASEIATSVPAVRTEAPGTLTVHAAFPNPFGPLTTLRWSLAESRDVTVTLYDVSGRQVRRLVSGRQGPGEHQVTWDGTDRIGRRGSAGVYLYRVQAGREIAHGRVVLAR
jgi:cytochrome c peroxidase